MLPTAAAWAASPTHHKATGVHRVGGKVSKAWPAVGSHRPKTRLDRWLARQVGAKPARVCATLPKTQRTACRGASNPASTRRVLMSLPTGEGTLDRVLALPSKLALAPVATGPLSLLRSYDIPKGDPSYDRLLNWSWTYDSSVAAAAFAAHGEQAEAQRLLDQLTALQGKNGSIDFAFNTSTGEASGTYSAGTVAWLGMAAVTYDQAFSSDRYQGTAVRAGAYLLSLRRPEDGLVRGGPTVQWVSTLHNLLAYTLLQGLGGKGGPGGPVAERFSAAADQIGKGIDSELLVQDESGAHFREGVGDDVQALDTQAIGSMYLAGRGQPDLGKQVLDAAAQDYFVGDRSMTLSKRKRTYNATYESNGPFMGFRPYLGKTAPDVISFEGTSQMRLAMTAFGEDTGKLDDSLGRWARVTGYGKEAPLGSDRTELNASFGEYHVWPTGAAAAWGILSGAAASFYVAPLPPEATLVTDWNASGGGISWSSAGPMSMTSGECCERQLLSGNAGDADYKVAVNAQLQGGSGYSVLVRSAFDPSNAHLSGYAVQYDQAAGVIDLVQWIDDQRLKAPLAVFTPAPDFDWAAQHTLSVTVSGNTLTASIDDQQVLDVPDLATASAEAAQASGIEGVTAPATGQYGVEAPPTGLVVFPQFTVAYPDAVPARRLAKR